MQRLLLFLAFMAFGSGMFYLLTVEETPRLELPSEDLPANLLAMREVTIRQHDGGSLKYELFARSAQFDELAKTGLLATVKFKVFSTAESGARQVYLQGRAGRALLDKDQGKVVLEGKVLLVDMAGAEIRSQRIEYEQESERVVSPGEVWVKTRGGTHHGSSLVYEIQARKMTFAAPLFYQ